MIGEAPGPGNLEIQEGEVVAAMRDLPQGHDIDWLGAKNGVGTFDRKDGVALQVYKSPGIPGDAARYSGDISPAAQADGYASAGYPTREDATLAELVAWLAAWDGSEVDVVEMLAQAPAPAVRFPWTAVRSERVDRLIADLGSPRWRFALVALYLAKGEYAPPLAKLGSPTATTGVTFGFCDEEGNHKPLSEAPTHAGWRFDEDPEEGQ